MSRAYYEKFGRTKINRIQMDKFLQPVFGKMLTEQNHKKETNINNILKTYNKTGLLTHVQSMEAKYGDYTGADFKTMLDIVSDVKSNFNELPPEIRDRFKNDPQKYLEFFENPANREEAIKLGLVHENVTEETDGLGEHVTEKPTEKVVTEKPPVEA